VDFVRAFKVAVVIAVIVAAGWLFREDHLCRAEINQRLGPDALITHAIGSTNYDVVPKSWKAAWRAGDPYPVFVTCWTDMGGISKFTQH
jgi:hypothetical protein